MRDKIFETSANLSVTDNSAILQAQEQGSSVSLSWGAWFLILIVVCAVAAVATTVAKKKEGAAGGGADVAKK
jgi:hypothetical protein